MHPYYADTYGYRPGDFPVAEAYYAGCLSLPCFPDLTEDDLRELAPQLDSGFYDLLEQGAWLESKTSEGGTALARVQDQLAQARRVLSGEER